MIPKFRAWDKENEVMSCIDEVDFNSGIVLISTGFRYFENLEIMQYTRLKDKNGVEIFENNIVNVHEFINVGGIEGYEEGEKEMIGIIKYGCVYDSPIPEWYLQTKDDCVSFSYMDLHEESFEVISNVYEHPHLLRSDR